MYNIKPPEGFEMRYKDAIGYGFVILVVFFFAIFAAYYTGLCTGYKKIEARFDRALTAKAGHHERIDEIGLFLVKFDSKYNEFQLQKTRPPAMKPPVNFRMKGEE